MNNNNKSEVAALLLEIDERRRAAEAGLSDYAAVSSHAAISKQMEAYAGPVLQLFRKGYPEEAARLWESQW